MNIDNSIGNLDNVESYHFLNYFHFEEFLPKINLSASNISVGYLINVISQQWIECQNGLEFSIILLQLNSDVNKNEFIHSDLAHYFRTPS